MSTTEIVWQDNPSWRGMTLWYAKALALAIGVAALAFGLRAAGVIAIGHFALVAFIALVLVVGIGYLKRHTTVYTITRERVMEKSGIVNTTKEQAQISQITNITVNRSLGERILGIGRVNIDTANDRRDILDWWGVEKPYEVEGIIDSLRADQPGPDIPAQAPADDAGEDELI